MSSDVQTSGEKPNMRKTIERMAHEQREQAQRVTGRRGESQEQAVKRIRDAVIKHRKG